MVFPGSSGPEGTKRPPQTARKPPKPKTKTMRETCAAPQTAPTRSLASDADAQQRCQMASLQCAERLQEEFRYFTSVPCGSTLRYVSDADAQQAYWSDVGTNT